LPSPHAFIVTYGGGHAQIGAALAREWVQQGGKVTVLALTTASAVYQDAGIPTLGMRDLPECQSDSVLAWGARLAGDVTRHPDVPEGETEAYLGAGMSDLIEDVGEEEALRRFGEKGRTAFLPHQTLARVLDRIQPDIVVATNSPRAEMAALRAARAKGIPSLFVADLFVGPELDRLGATDYADVACVLAESEKRHLVAAGWDPAHVRVTGNPAFDGLSQPVNVEAGQAWREQLGHAGPVVLWASQPGVINPDFSRDVARRLAEAGGQHDWKVVWRPHPNEEEPPVIPGVLYSQRDEPLEPLLYGVDVVVVVSSTVGLQAALAHRRVTQLDVPVPFHSAPYSAMGIAERACGPDDLPRAISAALDKPTPNGDFLPECGQATQRVVDAMHDLLRA